MAGETKIGRNDRCPCGSGRKYKNCCQGKSARMGPGRLGRRPGNPGGCGVRHRVPAQPGPGRFGHRFPTRVVRRGRSGRPGTDTATAHERAARVALVLVQPVPESGEDLGGADSADYTPGVGGRRGAMLFAGESAVASSTSGR